MRDYTRYNVIKNKNLTYDTINIAQIQTELASNFKIESDQKVTVAIGDLHGNALKAIRFLIEIGMIDLSQHNLQDIYRTLQNSYLSNMYDKFENALDKIVFDIDRIKQTKLVFIGDTLADRGHSDYMTLLVFKKMAEKGIEIDYTICLSNHDVQFIYYLDVYLFPEKTTSLEGLPCIYGQGEVCVSYDLDKLDKTQKHKLLINYYEVYLSHLKVMEYEAIEGKEIVYSHAPCNFEAIKKIKFAPKGKNLHDTIADINNSFQAALTSAENLFGYNWVYDTGLFEFVWNRKTTTTKFVEASIINIFGHVSDMEIINQNQVNLDSDLGKYNIFDKKGLKIFSVYKYQPSSNLKETVYKSCNSSTDNGSVKSESTSKRKNIGSYSSKTSAKIKDIEPIKGDVLEILEKYLKTNPNNASRSRNVWLYFKGRNHIGRLEKVFNSIKSSTSIEEIQSILENQKNIFDFAHSYTKSKDSQIYEHWNKFGGIKNVPQNLDSSKFYQTIRTAITAVNVHVSSYKNLDKRTGNYNVSNPNSHFNVNSEFFTTLPNVGNTCYINSSLQLLDHINGPSQNFFKFQAFSTRSGLSSLISDFWLPDGQTFNSNTSQQDAAEFLQSLINSNRYKESFLPIFKISHRVQKKVTSCQTHAHIPQFSTDDLNMLHIGINEGRIQQQHNLPLKKLLEEAEQEEMPLNDQVCYACMEEAHDNDYSVKNEKKYKRGHGVETRKLISASKYFIIHLKRFGYDQDGGVYKISSTINIEDELRIQDENYKLVAYIVHEGKSLRNGHYYLISLKKYPVLYKISDDQIAKIYPSEEIKLRKQAYIILYKKNGN
ncbi:ubiquitin carboxyl-terminal hydrolase [Allofrancisella guangzhouensis]|uniref:ubiquitinyl hydrolase 1 n=1 Tax=Allofrancisella guangzhouensis TaxID=594679 RepID=A0A0A8E3V9_9GAMM|nr:ubiquitin carboxyl-terminal hydrolase family protein [Allofrancisella guangzhouensis]AJC48673.1 hypothetical protein SD28_02930 [Allofrancisella guangzhouensis]MBK2027482.1 ubiquitin carboxyl-terminal hydrolase [Allofrancisella guangzhouensis]MBK2044504.1 ubiquitin carboxyl-terminal hydrolase [Allofrancisella guangzhouensis]MBK2045403.1 ubiquitin carboxyl-terminal hydrolase [Allofrancisella guangzhouensis]